MPSEFDNINDLAGWRAKFDELLAAAQSAAADDDLQNRLAVSRRLTDFIINNPPGGPDPADAEYASMDRIASQIVNDLLLQSVQERVRGIANRTAELVLLRKKIDQQSGANAASAASIRLDKARRVVDATTGVVSAMVEFRNELRATGDSDDTDLAKRIEALVTRIQNVRNEIESVM